MSNRDLKHITISGVDYSRYLPFPFEETLTLDESLSTSSVRLVNTRIKAPFKPFSRVRLGIGSSARWYILSDDIVTEHRGTGLYTHDIGLVEQTKETERISTGGKAFTNPLVRDYTDGQTIAKYIILRKTEPVAESVYEPIADPYDNYSRSFLDNTYVSPIRWKSNFAIYPLKEATGINVDTTKKITYKVYHNPVNTPFVIRELTGGNEGLISLEMRDGTQLIAQDTVLPTDKIIIKSDTYGKGIYTILYGAFDDTDSLQSHNDYLYIELYAVDNAATRDPYTIDQVIYQRLRTAETLRRGDYPRYRLVYQGDQQSRFQAPAPEMHFPNGRTLWEDLQEIGKVIHAIPRVEDDRLYFDDLGGTEYADMSKGKPYGGESLYSIADYTAALESYANNLVNLDDEAEGSLTEPFNGGFVSLRANVEEVRIGEETGLFRVSNPIEKPIKVTVRFNGKEGDITPYLFDKSEYDLLSSFAGQYPTSKTYALYYTRGGNTIEGLWYKAQDSALDIINALESYAIVNIMRAVFNEPLIVLDPKDYPDITVSVTYVPLVNARVRNYRPDFDGEFPSVLTHNQSANKLSSSQFGENLRGQLAMLGTTSDSKMYIYSSADDIPKVGTLYDKDNYISSIIARHYHGFTLAQIQLSTGYNQLGARVEINNAIRQFEIPEAEDRYILYEEFCQLGSKQTDDGDLALTESMKESIYRVFDGASSYADGMDVSLAVVNTYDDDMTRLTAEDIALPVVSLSLGNSLYFGFRFLDNFSAGTSSTGNASQIGGKFYREQAHIPYGDPWYSEATYMTMSLWTGADNTTLETAHNLPLAGDIAKGVQMVDIPASSALVVYKDSADALCLTYQIHFVTDEGYIIGDGLAHACAAVRTAPVTDPPKVYFFPHRINQLTGTVDTSTAVASSTVVCSRESRWVHAVSTPSVAYQSWAIIKGGRFVVGKNDAKFNGFYLSFRRSLL